MDKDRGGKRVIFFLILDWISLSNLGYETHQAIHVYSTSLIARLCSAFLAFDICCTDPCIFNVNDKLCRPSWDLNSTATNHGYSTSMIDFAFLAFDFWWTEPYLVNFNNRLCVPSIWFLIHWAIHLKPQGSMVPAWHLISVASSRVYST